MINASFSRVAGLTALLLCLLCIPQASGQVRDAGLWTSVAVEAKIIKKLSASFSQEIRLNENISEAGSSLSEVGLEYKLNKYLKVSGNYRYTLKRRTNNQYSPRHRFFVDIKAEKKIKPVIFQIRTRLQDEYADIGRSPDGGIARFYARNKFSLKLDLDKMWQPYVSLELFSPLQHDQAYMFDNLRSSAGVEFSLSKHHKLDVYYMIQREINVNEPVTDFIAGLGYVYKL